MKKIIFFIIALAIIGFAGYKYFNLDTNQAFQNAFKSKNLKEAEMAIKNAVFDTVQVKAKEYFNQHNNYFISKSNNVCIGIQTFFSGVSEFSSNPIECSAKEHTFTARLKSGLTKTYYCADSTGFYTLPLEGVGFQEGVKCK